MNVNNKYKIILISIVLSCILIMYYLVTKVDQTSLENNHIKVFSSTNDIKTEFELLNEYILENNLNTDDYFFINISELYEKKEHNNIVIAYSELLTSKIEVGDKLPESIVINNNLNKIYVPIINKNKIYVYSYDPTFVPNYEQRNENKYEKTIDDGIFVE